MKMRMIAVVAFLVTVWPTFAQPKAPGIALPLAKPGLAPTSCVVRIVCDTSALTLSEEAAQELFNVALEGMYPDFREGDSPFDPIEGRAAVTLYRLEGSGRLYRGRGLSGPPSIGGPLVVGPESRPLLASSTLTCVLKFACEKDQCEPVRQGFWEALCGRVDAMLKETSQLEWQRREHGLEVAEQQLTEISGRLQQLADLEQTLRTRAGVEDLGLDRVLQRQSSLRERLADMERDLKRAEAQENAILQQIARVNEQAQGDPDPVAEEMEKIVAARQAKVDQARSPAQAFRASGTDLSQAEAELAEARVRLLQQRTERRAQAGGQMVGKLRERLAEVAIRAEEIRGESEFLRQELEGMESRNVTAIAAEYERQIGSLPENLRERMHVLQQQVDALRTELAARQTPSVTILGGL